MASGKTAKKTPNQQCRGDKRPKNIPEVTEVLRMAVREENGVWDWLAIGTGKAREWGRGAGGAVLAPDSREGFWDLSGDPHAHPRGARQDSVPPSQVITLIPKYLRSCSRKTKVRTV